MLGIEELSKEEVYSILDRAKYYVSCSRSGKKHDKSIMSGKTQVNLFFENSTRTQTSFEIAGKRLGADVMNMNPRVSSIKKGETILDTALTLNAMSPDILVVRHSESGTAKILSQKINCSVINAGDGTHEHPTQALLDALTILHHKQRINGLVVAICGDVLHSRVARSNIFLLTKLHNEVRIIAPETLIPCDIEKLGVTVYHNIYDGLLNCDVVMILRLQTERMSESFIPSTREYFHRFGLDYNKLSRAKPNVIVMHPGPINRGVEIDSNVADDINRSVIHEQVSTGVAVRMAVLDILSDQGV